MAIRLSNQEINQLINEPKPLPDNYKSFLRLRNKKGHRERDFEITGTDGNKFRIIQRQAEFNVLDFSVILAYCPRNSNETFILRRYNGKSHEHSNTLENQTFFDFHIHQATERYQDIGAKVESYANATQDYSTIDEATQRLFTECGFVIPPDKNPSQGKLL